MKGTPWSLKRIMAQKFAKKRTDSNTAEGIWRHVEKSSDGCWNCVKVANESGYCQYRLNGHNIMAHRLVFELLRGPIPKGMQLDHLCRNRRCVNPDHLEVVTLKENVLRGTGISAENARKKQCKRGHLFSKENTYIRNNGRRNCRECSRKRQRLWRESWHEQIEAAEQAMDAAKEKFDVLPDGKGS